MRQAPKVVVVGAGLAGLTAAYRLQNAGCDVQVYEARSRPGGRIHSAVVGDTVQELGGSNFMDAGEPVSVGALIKELGLTVEEWVHNASAQACFDGQVFEQSALFAKAPRADERLFLALQTRIPLANSLGQILDEVFAEHKTFRRYLDVLVRGWEGAPAAELAPEYAETSFWELYSRFSSYANDPSAALSLWWMIKGGNNRLIYALCDRLAGRITYQAPLLSIGYSSNQGYILGFAEGRQVVADYVVLAIPCSTLKDVVIQPGLFPEDQLAAINNIPYGSNSKIVIPVQQALFSSPIHAMTDVVRTWFDPAHNALTWYIGAEYGRFNDRSAEAVEAIVQQQWPLVEKIFSGIKPSFGLQVALHNDEVKAYQAPVGISWFNEQYSKGSFAFYSPGQYKQFVATQETFGGERVKQVFRPINQGLLFAGEHTALDGAEATLEGAAQSGDRVARMILRLIA